MIVWPVTRSSTITANSSAALTVGDQFQSTLSGVRTTKTASTTSWNRKQPRPGPRSGWSSSPRYWTGPVVAAGGAAGSGRRRDRMGRRRAVTGGVVAVEVVAGLVGHEAQRYAGRSPTVRAHGLRAAGGATRLRPGGGRLPVLRRPHVRGSARRISGVEMTFQDRDPPPRMIRSRAMTRASTQIGRLGRQPEHRDAADLHAGQPGRLLGRGERGFARAQPVADGPVHVQAIRCQRHAGGEPRRVGLADDHDRVGRVLGREPVGGTEGGRVGQRGIAREELVGTRPGHGGAPRARLGRVVGHRRTRYGDCGPKRGRRGRGWFLARPRERHLDPRGWWPADFRQMPHQAGGRQQETGQLTASERIRQFSPALRDRLATLSHPAAHSARRLTSARLRTSLPEMLRQNAFPAASGSARVPDAYLERPSQSHAPSRYHPGRWPMSAKSPRSTIREGPPPPTDGAGRSRRPTWPASPGTPSRS